MGNFLSEARYSYFLPLFQLKLFLFLRIRFSDILIQFSTLSLIILIPIACLLQKFRKILSYLVLPRSHAEISHRNEKKTTYTLLIEI